MARGPGYSCQCLLSKCKTDFLLEHILFQLQMFTRGMLILGGDMNVALNPNIDTSDGKTPLSYQALQRIKQALHYLHLMYTWCILFLKERDYSFYSHPNNKYVCLDYIFISQTDLNRLIHTEIGVGTFSDHFLISASFSLAGPRKGRPPWQLDAAMLTDQLVVDNVTSWLCQTCILCQYSFEFLGGSQMHA